MGTINMDRVVEILRDEHSVEAYVEMTGGGVATIFAGDTYPNPEDAEDVRHAAVAGPGTYNHRDLGFSVAETEEFFVGADDMGESRPVDSAELEAVFMTELGRGLNEHDVARVIAAQAYLPFGACITLDDAKES